MSDVFQNETVGLVFRSRETILDMLRRRGCDTTAFDKYTLKDITTALEDSNDLSRLDMRCPQLATAPQEGRLPFTFVRYRVMDKIKNKLHNLFVPPVNLEGVVVDDGTTSKSRRSARTTTQSVLEGFNRETDELILITGEPTGEAFHKAAADAFAKYGVRISMFYIRDLVVNRLNHVLVPPHVRIPPSEHAALLQRLLVLAKTRLPAIRFHEDIIARMLGLYPGDIVEIKHPSRTAAISTVYRHCM